MDDDDDDDGEEKGGMVDDCRKDRPSLYGHLCLVFSMEIQMKLIWGNMFLNFAPLANFFVTSAQPKRRCLRTEPLQPRRPFKSGAEPPSAYTYAIRTHVVPRTYVRACVETVMATTATMLAKRRGEKRKRKKSVVVIAVVDG